ncbi:hypothetical protein [Profundibacter sp.]
MIALFVGVLVFLAGAAIVENAAFSDRAIMGAVIVLVGVCIFGVGVIEVVVRLLMMGGVW